MVPFTGLLDRKVCTAVGSKSSVSRHRADGDKGYLSVEKVARHANQPTRKQLNKLPDDVHTKLTLFSLQ
jgi:hypothetical protein